MSAPRISLSDDVISLTPIEPSDAICVMEWDADPEIQRWFDWPLTPSASDPETYPARLASAEETARGKRAAWEAGSEFVFIIRSVQTSDGLGWLDLQPRGGGRGNVAYGVLERHRRRGAATRSVVLATRYAFDVLGWVRLELCAIADNVASRSVAVKAGYQLDAVLRSYGAWEKHEPLVGRRFDWAIYSRLRGDA
jgi:RimJ/RimL family protein N-acetyltransferase